MMWICLCRFADRPPLWTRMMLGCTYFDMDIVLTCATCLFLSSFSWSLRHRCVDSLAKHNDRFAIAPEGQLVKTVAFSHVHCRLHTFVSPAGLNQRENPSTLQ